MRGEDLNAAMTANPIGGAPPRAWGGRRHRTAWRHPRRSTPTCVGRTISGGHCMPSEAEHPHVRGEDPDPDTPQAVVYGAPPRAWGGPPVTPPPGPRMRSTPTCVGRTPRPPDADRRTAEHPTCVGRTRLGGAHGSLLAEHPHVRGEDQRALAERAFYNGAPPRAWGGRVPALPRPGAHRSTPTCVGRIEGSVHDRLRPTEHPHVRGEDRTHRPRAVRISGVPPRAWGGPPPSTPTTRTRWSTPTCVGRTMRWSRPRSRSAEHPHVRGEDLVLGSGAYSEGGAPPRAWGGRVLDRQ